MPDKPFGLPDGSHANINELLDRHFVEFDPYSYGSGIGLSNVDLTTRVIVGAKGAGKTAYLRRLHNGVKGNTSVYVPKTINRDTPLTDDVLKFCSMFSEKLLTEKWMALWRCAILRSLLSHLLYERDLREYVEDEILDELTTLAKPAGLRIRAPISIYAAAKHILHECDREDIFQDLSSDPVWDALVYFISEAVHDIPPCCFILDSVDDEYGHAPMHWLRAQKGLFYTTMRLLRDDRLGGRLHVIIAIRDHVYSSVLRSEHQNRYRGEPHIRVLDWDWDSISHLLRKKIARLHSRYICNDSLSTGSLYRIWLGHDKIRNGGRDLLESVESYIIRHTRQLPRDIVQVGNALCELTSVAVAEGRTELTHSQIRECISEQAKSFGDEQLKICVNQIISSGMPNEAGRYRFSDLYTGNVEYEQDLVDDLKEVLRDIGKDAFTSSELQAAVVDAEERFGRGSDAFSVLWQNRLIGYRARSRETTSRAEVFYAEHNLDEFRLPRDKTEYYLHPCLIDSVGLVSAVETPLHPGRKRSE